METDAIIRIALAAVAGAAAFVMRSAAHKIIGDEKTKKIKTFRTLMLVLMIISGWYFIGVIVSEFSGGPGGLEVEFELFSPRTTLFGLSLSNTTIITWVIIAIVLIISLLFRFLVFPRFSEKPHGLQNAVELAVETMHSFTKNTVGNLSDELPAYMFSVAVLLVGCAASELFGQRPPTSDLVMTFSLGLVTFFLINILSIKKKGIKGRLKGLATPSPIIFPMKILSDISVPVSLACRLFGNMLGGMIVMDLLKSSLGGYSVGLTALAGLYFNIFHPLIQTYIFIILSLTFINEATEDEH
jgi:F-type H+-transporting ATPase subunit a